MTPTVFLRAPGRKHKPEAEFQAAIIQYLKARYGPKVWILNHVGGLGQRSGIPDLLCCIEGRFLALEVKSPLGNGRLGPRQKEELRAIREAGGIAAVVSFWEELEEALGKLSQKAMGTSKEPTASRTVGTGPRKEGEADEVPG